MFIPFWCWVQGPESYVESKSSYELGLHVAVKDMPVYGAGRSMQDMLESGKGLPLMIRVRSRSSYRVVWNLISLRYLHHEECLLVLDGAFDRKHQVHVHNSTCFSATHHKWYMHNILFMLVCVEVLRFSQGWLFITGVLWCQLRCNAVCL